MANVKTQVRLPDWWRRENQRRQVRLLVFLVLVLALIGYYYYTTALGIVAVSGINFDTTDYIAFVRQNNEGNASLYAIRADGSSERRLTLASDHSNKEHPVWTIDGKNIIYASNRNDSKLTQIYILGDGEPQQLSYGTGNKSFPTINPDGKHTAFIAQGAIKTLYINGKDVFQVLPQPRAGNEGIGDSSSGQVEEPTGPFLSIQFSSDGTGVGGTQDISNELALSEPGAVGADQAVTVIPPGGGKTAVLDMGREVSLSWEGKGNRLATSFTEIAMQGADQKMNLISGIRIWSFDQGRSSAKNLFIGVGRSIAPKHIAWSPDGSKMAFEGWRLKADGSRELRGIVVMEIGSGGGVGVDPKTADTVKYMVPTTHQGKPQRPLWSPDGKRLVYEMVRPDGKRDLWVINTDGTNPINLTKGIGDNMDAAWSPTR